MDYAEPTFSSRRATGVAFVALLHVVIIYALVSGLGVQVVQVLHQPLEAQIIQEIKPARTPPAPPPPHLVKPPPPYIPPPLVHIAPPPVPVIAAVTTVRPPAPPPPVQAVRSQAGLDANQSCAAPEYPQDAEDMGQTGTSVLQFLVAADGAVEKSLVASSSGHTELDDAALAALGQCHFKPAIGADGQPQESWATIPYVWRLN
jgi:protein TonB